MQQSPLMPPTQINTSVTSNQEAVTSAKQSQLLADNNRRAYEMLLRIQSQQQMSTVTVITPKRENA